MSEITTTVSDAAEKSAVAYPVFEGAEQIDLAKEEDYAATLGDTPYWTPSGSEAQFTLPESMDFDLDGRYTDEDHVFHREKGKEHLTSVPVEKVSPDLVARARNHAETFAPAASPFYPAFEIPTQRATPIEGHRAPKPERPVLTLDEVKAAFRTGDVLTGSLIDTPITPAHGFPNAVYAHITVRADRSLTPNQWNNALMNPTFRGDNTLVEFIQPIWAYFQKGRSGSVTAVYELYQNYPSLQKDILPEDALPISALSELEDSIANVVQHRLDPDDSGKLRVKGVNIRRTTRSGHKPMVGIMRVLMSFQNRRCHDLLTPIVESQQRHGGRIRRANNMDRARGKF